MISFVVLYCINNLLNRGKWGKLPVEHLLDYIIWLALLFFYIYWRQVKKKKKEIYSFDALSMKKKHQEKLTEQKDAKKRKSVYAKLGNYRII